MTGAVTLEDQIKTTIILLLNYRKAFKSDEIRVSQKILKQNGLDNVNFWEVICPMLEKEASLKYSRVPYIDVIDPIKNDRAWRKLDESLSQQKELYSNRHYEMFPDKEREKLLDQQKSEAWEEISSSSNSTYKFEVNTTKLKRLHALYTQIPTGEKPEPKRRDISNKLYLSRHGDLWREPKEKYCYKMKETSRRYKIVQFLANNKGYMKPSVIRDFAGNKTDQSVRTEIGKIRKNIKTFLKMDGMEIIEEGRHGSGYQINPKHKITAEHTNL